MKSSLEYLPNSKREELQEIVKIILDNSSKKTEMILLYGSHATGNWAEERYSGDDGIVYEHKSDFDILVVTSSVESSKKWVVWKRVKKKIQRRKSISTWVSLITIDIRTLNNELKKGRYFYCDIKKEGIVLYDSEKCKLAKAKEMTAEELKEEAEGHYKKWFTSASEFLISFRSNFERNSLNIAAFELHQVTERLFSTTLLVFTGYKPKLHDLEKLYGQVIGQSQSFISIFPQTADFEKQNFDLLKRAYRLTLRYG